jgi:hypothetical protein
MTENELVLLVSLLFANSKDLNPLGEPQPEFGMLGEFAGFPVNSLILNCALSRALIKRLRLPNVSRVWLENSLK